MSYQMLVEDCFTIEGKGVVVIGRPLGTPTIGRAIIEAPPQMESIQVEVTKVKPFTLSSDLPVKDDNYGIFLERRKKKIPIGSIIRKAF